MNRLIFPSLALVAGLALATVGERAMSAPSTTDETFARTAAAAGMAEVEFGNVAVQKANSPPILTFARRMVADHSKSNEQLAALAQKQGISLPHGMDEEHRVKLTGLSKLSGAAFDRAYIESQVGDHQKAVQLFETEIGSGKDQALRDFAKATLPTLMEHLEMAQGASHQLIEAGSQSTTNP